MAANHILAHGSGAPGAGVAESAAAPSGATTLDRSASLQAERAAYLQSVAPFSVFSLKGGADRSLDAIAEQVQGVVRSERFLELLQHNINVAAQTSPADGKGAEHWQNKLTSTPNFAQHLRDTILDVLERTRVALCAEQESGHLRLEDLHLEAIFNRKRTSRQVFGQFLQTELDLTEGQRVNVVGAIIPLVQRTVGQAVVLNGETEQYSPTGVQLVNIAAMDLPFLSDPKDRAKLARRTAGEDPGKVSAFLQEVADIPQLPLLDAQSQFATRLHQRLQRNLAMLEWDTERTALGQAHNTVVSVFRELAQSQDLQFYLNYFGGERATMQRLYEGVKTGNVTFFSISCPDYSGQVLHDGPKPQWHFDFQSLGDGPGIVAEKGVAPIKAWVAALSRHGVGVTYYHCEPSFEVHAGFPSRDPAQTLDREGALDRLRRSNEKIVARLAEEGVPAIGCLTDELIPDRDFVARREEQAHIFRSTLGTDAELDALFNRIYDTRKAFYHAWHGRESTEQPDVLERRIRMEIIPLQVAEYFVIGKALTSQPGSIILSYDSPVMGEAYGRFGIPAIFGQDRRALDYSGAL